MNPIERFHVTLRRQENGPALLLTRSSAPCAPDDSKELIQRARGIRFPENGYVSPLNLFFHRLPSGRFALGRLLPNGPYGSGEPFTSSSYSVEYLLVPPDVLLRFGNNPILFFQTLLENGQITPFSKGVSQAVPVEVPVPVAGVDEPLLDGLSVAPGSGPLCFLLQSVLESIVTRFTGTPSPLQVVSALFTLLPPSWRPELTFALGVPFAEKFPWRLAFLPSSRETRAGGDSAGKASPNGPAGNDPAANDPDGSSTSACPEGIPQIDLAALARSPVEPHLISGWPLFIKEVLDQSQYTYLENCFATEFPAMDHDQSDFVGGRVTVEDINHIGFTSLYELKHLLGELGPGEVELLAALTGRVPGSGDRLSGPSSPMQLEHEQPLVLDLGEGRLLAPYQQLVASWPSLDPELLQFDSLVAQSLENDYGSLESLRSLWEKFCERKDESLLWMVREQYTHYIQAVLLDQGRDGSRNVQKSLYALEVLEMLFQAKIRRPE